MSTNKQIEPQSDILLDKSLPSNISAERILLGSVLRDNEVMSDIAEVIAKDDFYNPVHRIVYGAMLELFNRSWVIDPITLIEEIKKMRGLNTDDWGGISFLLQLTHGMPHFLNVDEYIRVVFNKSRLRKLIYSCNKIVQDAVSEETETDEVFQRAEQEVYTLSDSVNVSNVSSNSIDIIDERIARAHQIQDTGVQITGIASGYTDLDSLTLGLHNDDLIIVAARPSVGKTVLGFNIGQNAAYVENKIVAGFSLEMSKGQLGDRLICAEAGVDSHKFRNGSLTSAEWDAIIEAREHLDDSTLLIDDTPAINTSFIRSRCRRIKKQYGALDMIIVDYLQLMTGVKSIDNREQEVSSISRELKGIAKEFHVPVIALSQLNRKSENRANHIPTMADLRESGAIEQDADMILFIHRKDMYIQDEMEKDRIADIVIAKNRNGPTDTIELLFEAEFNRFVNLDQNAEF